MSATLAAPAMADFVIRDRAGKRIEVIDEGPAGALIRLDPQGRRLGYVETRPGAHVLRDERGRRVGVIRDGVGGLEAGVVRDRAGRRIGTIERR